MSKHQKSNNFPITCPPLVEESFIRPRPSRGTGTIGPIKATGTPSVVEGIRATKTMESAKVAIDSREATHAEGAFINTLANYSHTEGLYTSHGDHIGAHIMGRYGTADADFSWFLANGFQGFDGLAAKILYNGNAYIDVAWNSGGADYAELFETESGQPIEPGYFVTFTGTSDKIRIAQAYDDYVLGVISRAPGFVAGGGELRWKDKYISDDWGGIVYEDVAVPDEMDAKGKLAVPAHTEKRPFLNPDYNPDHAYLPREVRPEWVKVGLLGRLLVRDDGTLTAGGYCRPGMNGIAAAAHSGYRVLKRTGPNQVMILLR